MRNEDWKIAYSVNAIKAIEKSIKKNEKEFDENQVILDELMQDLKSAKNESVIRFIADKILELQEKQFELQETWESLIDFRTKYNN